MLHKRFLTAFGMTPNPFVEKGWKSGGFTIALPPPISSQNAVIPNAVRNLLRNMSY
jgi:hypothetical protein